MTKAILEKILTEYGAAFNDALADRLMKEFDEMTQNYCHTITCLSDRLREVYEKNSIAYQAGYDYGVKEWFKEKTEDKKIEDLSLKEIKKSCTTWGEACYECPLNIICRDFDTPPFDWNPTVLKTVISKRQGNV